jgi:hypothetical protein
MEITEAMARVLPNSNSLLNNPTFVQAFLSVAAEPNDPNLTWYFKLEEVMKQQEEAQAAEYVQQLRLSPGVAEMIEQRYVGSKYKLEDLKKDCAPGTLGYAYYHHMTQNGRFAAALRYRRQSVGENAGKKGEVYGFDGGKLVKGRLRPESGGYPRTTARRSGNGS